MGLTLDGMEKWQLTNDATSPLVVQDRETFASGREQLFRVSIDDGAVVSQPFRGTLMHVNPDKKSLLVKRYSSDRNAGTYRSSISCQIVTDVEGQPLWEHCDFGSLARSTAFGMEWAVSSGRLIVGKGSARLLSIDLESGAIKWDADLNQSKPEPNVGVAADIRVAPLVHGNVVLAPTPFGFGAVAVETGELLWSHHVHAGPFNVYKDRLYMAAGINVSGYRIVDMKTGSLLFEREVSVEIAKKYGFDFVKLSSGFAITESHTFVGDNFGRLWALERDTGEPVWYHHPENATAYVALRQPVIWGNRLYINSFSTDPSRPQHLYCYEQS